MRCATASMSSSNSRQPSRVGEKAEVGGRAVRAVAAMVVRVDGIAGRGQRLREPRVAGGMFGEAVDDLHDGARRRSGRQMRVKIAWPSGRGDRDRVALHLVLPRWPAQRLDLAAPPLGLEPPLLRGERRPGRAARLVAMGGALDQRGQPVARVLAVARLAGEALRENDDDAVLRRARARRDGSAARRRRRAGRRAARVEAQLDRRRNLVDVLPAGAGGAREGLAQFALVDEKRRRPSSLFP